MTSASLVLRGDSPTMLRRNLLHARRHPSLTSNPPLAPIVLLPLVSSAFVPVDAAPGRFRPIAEYQPFTPAMETLRGLLLGSGTGHNGWLAVTWRLGLTLLGHFWSKTVFDRDQK